MQAILVLLKKIPFWGWIIVALVLLLVVNQVSGSIYSKKLWKMVRDGVVTEEQKIIKDRDSSIQNLEKEKKDSQSKITQLQNEGMILQKKGSELERRNRDLQDKLDKIAHSIPPASDLSGLAERFKKSGYKPVVLRRN